MNDQNREARILSYEELLLDFVTRLDRYRAGRVACELRLELFRPYHRQPHHLRIVRKTLEPLTRRFDAGIYEMHNRNVIVVAKDATFADVERYVVQIRSLFSEDPLFIGQDESQFCDCSTSRSQPIVARPRRPSADEGRMAQVPRRPKRPPLVASKSEARRRNHRRASVGQIERAIEQRDCQHPRQQASAR
ncbi:MAG: hypothetical protein R3D05_20305 [Dongiaceae bacterium]